MTKFEKIQVPPASASTDQTPAEYYQAIKPRRCMECGVGRVVPVAEPG